MTDSFDQKRLSFEKYQAVTKALEETYALVHVDPNVEGVELPDHLKQDETVTLKLSYHFRGKVEVTKKHIEANLSFSGSYFTCIIPLFAVWGLTTEAGKNIIWPDSTPKAMLSAIESRMGEPNEQEPQLKEAGDGKDSEEEASQSEETIRDKKRPTLRRVK